MSDPTWNQPPWAQGPGGYRPPPGPQGPPPQGPPPQGPRQGPPPQQWGGAPAWTPPQQAPPQQAPPQQAPPQQAPPQQAPPRATPAPGGAGGHRSPDRGRRRAPLIAGLGVGALVLLAGGGVGGYFIGHKSGPDRLAPDDVAAGVTKVLENDYGIDNVVDVSCPHPMDVTVHARYTCTFTAGSAKGDVDIVVQNTAGQYLVQGPKA